MSTLTIEERLEALAAATRIAPPGCQCGLPHAEDLLQWLERNQDRLRALAAAPGAIQFPSALEVAAVADQLVIDTLGISRKNLRRPTHPGLTSWPRHCRDWLMLMVISQHQAAPAAERTPEAMWHAFRRVERDRITYADRRQITDAMQSQILARFGRQEPWSRLQVDRPVFIPLRAEFFAAFASGRKTEEYRRYGRNWNEKNCRPGRPVVLSLGYGKSQRLTGRITSFREEPKADALHGWVQCFGADAGPAAVIGIAVDGVEVARG